MDILINYADAKYERSRWWNSFTGKHIAKFDKIYEFHPDDIDTEFSQQHQDILSYKRGNRAVAMETIFYLSCNERVC